MYVRLIRLLSVCLIAWGAANAQEFRATITGKVIDPSGAAVPGAAVQVKNVDTNEGASATTDAQGNYTVPLLRPATYTLTVEAPGFKKYSREGVTLQVGQTAGINVSLEIGNAQETVTVTAETPLLDTQKADRGGVVNTEQVTELPLNARNPYLLGSMMSGVNFRGASIWQRPFDNGAIAEWSVNGGWNSNNEFLLDGAPNNAQGGGNNVAYVPIVDAVQEFRVQSNSYDAQYGKTSGGVMNVILKSGTNDFHATGWEFLRRTALDANTFQNNSKGAPKSEHYLDQYGFQFDGPIYVPKLFDGRNKAFFLGSFENYREGTPSPLTLSVPQPEFLTGDFSKLVDANGNKITIYNPYTGHADPSVPGGWKRDPFPGNMIPPELINPVAKNILSYYPAPNNTAAGRAYSENNLIFPNYFAKDKFYNLILKFDFNFSDRHRAFFRHASNDRTEDRNDNGVFSGPGQGGQQPFQRINDAYVIDYVWTTTPTLILNARASYNRFIEKGFGADDLGFDITQLGFPSSLANSLPNGPFFGNYNFSGYTYLGRYRSVNITNNYSLNLNGTKVWNRHTMHFGLDVRRGHLIWQDTGNVLRFDFDRRWTQQTYNQGDALSGNAIASALLGLPNCCNSPYNLFPFFRQWYAAPFFQDDWKATSRLTLNFGLRWDFNFAPSEKYNRVNGGFDPNVTTTVDGPNGPVTLRGGVTFAGVDGLPARTARTDLNNIQPRVGFAYSLNDKLVLRGGFGIYYLNPNNDWLSNRAGFSTNTPLVTTLDDYRTPVTQNVLSDPFPGGINTPQGASQGPLTFVGNNFNWFNRDFIVPRQHQFSFGVQYETWRNSVFDVAYVGGRGYDFEMNRDINIPSLAFRQKCNILEGGSPNYCNEQVPNPFQGIEAFRGTSYFTAGTISRFNANRPYPQFSGALNEQGINQARTWYNSLQVNYNVRFKAGLNLLANYTFSKFTERWGYNDPYADVFQQGPYYLDRPHAFKLTTVYQLPFGQGRTFGRNWGKPLDLALGGWEWTTFMTWQSGEPADLPGNVQILKDPKIQDVSLDGYRVQGWSPCVLRMDDSGNITAQQYSLQAGCGTDFSNYAWMILPSYAPRQTPYRSGHIRMPSALTMDASLNKSFQVTERLRFQFRAEAFNLLNHYVTLRAKYNTDPNSSNFGSIYPGDLWTGDTGFPRQVQLGFKVYW